MQYSELKQLFNEADKRFRELEEVLFLDVLKKEIDDLEQRTYSASFWDDHKTATQITKSLKAKKQKYKRMSEFTSLYEELGLLLEFLEQDEEMVKEFIDKQKRFFELSDLLEIELLLEDSNDGLNAILEIHPGAGGTESQDWASMLFRMYQRFAEQNNYEFEILDYLDGEEAGLKSVTFSLKGDYAYGYLKAENGVHRLVRISPFDSGGRRHTSFASVNVYPEIDDTIDVEINENDLKIDTYRSSGAGGQSVNTTDSAVRITHLPSKIVVTVQNERSQIKNRDKAMQILKGKLYQLELERKQSEIDQYRTTSVENAFGSQIRSYVMHPYSMVKDHRTNIETGNVGKVMDGDLFPFINGYLKQQAGGNNIGND